MTVLREDRIVVSRGTGATYAWPFEFPITDLSYIRVYERDWITKEDTLLSPASYSVSGIGNASGGSVTYPLTGVALPLAKGIVIARVVPYLQQLDIVNEDGFYPENLEKALDNIVFQTQQLAEQVGRSIMAPSGVKPPQWLAGESSNLLYTDAEGTVRSSETTPDERSQRIAGEQALASLIGQQGVISDHFFETQLALSLATVSPLFQLVVVNGYSQAGDAPTHVFKRVSSEPIHQGKRRSLDRFLPNGTVSPENGGWWEISGPVLSFDHFGVDKSGITVADQGIKDCFDCAYAIGAKVVQNSGTYLWRHQQIDVLVDADLRGATILLDDESGVKPSTWAVETVFLIKNNVEKFDLSPVELADLNDNYRSGMRTNSYQLNHPVIVSHRDAYVQFYTDTVDILRGDGTDRKIFDHVITGAAGMLTVGFDRSFNAAPVTRCVVYPRETVRRYFYPPTFEAYNPGSLRCVRTERSNTYVGKFEWIEKFGPTEYMVRSLIEAADCVNVLFDGGSSEGQRMGGAAYTIAGGRCIGVTWRDYDAFDGWGTVGTNEIKDTQWIDCGLSRIDAHWGARGSNRAIRCTMKQGASTIGGSGKFSMVDCTYIIGPPASTADNATGAMLAARADYGNEFFGLFEVIRPRIVIAREVPETVFTRIAIVRAGGLVTYDPGRDVSLPNVIVENPMIVGSDAHGLSTNGLVIVACDLTDARFSVGDRKMIFPSSIRLTGGSFHGFSSNARVTLEAVKCNTHALSSTIARYPRSLPASANCEIIIDGVNQLVPDNVAPKTNSSPHLLDFKLSISNWSAEYIASGPNIWFPRIVISNSLKCSLLVPLKAFISVINSEIIMLDDDYGGRANTPVTIVGGTIRPYIDTPTSENEYIRANTFMSGVTMYISRKPNGNPGVTNLYDAKGAGNFVIDGGHVSPNAHYYGWDANCLNFWAL